MNNKKRSKFTKKYTLAFMFITLAVIVSLSLGTVSAADWTVGPGGTHNYTSIQDAINNESTLSGDTISVYDNNGTPYTYNENVVVNKTNLTLQSSGQVTVSGSSNPANPVFRINNQGAYAHITGFILSGATNSAGVMVTGTNDVTLNNLTINNCQLGVLMTGISSNIILDSLNISSTQGQGIYFNGDLTNITVIGAQISSTGNNAIDKYDFSNLNGLSVINTSITDPNGRGIFLTTFSDSSLKNILINNVNITGALYDGIYISMGNTNSGNVTITNSSIINSGLHGMTLNTRGILCLGNNTFFHNGYSGGDNQYYGLHINGAYNTEINISNDNRLVENRNGVRLNNVGKETNQLIFNGMQLINNAGYPVWINNGQYITITGVNFDDAATQIATGFRILLAIRIEGISSNIILDSLNISSTQGQGIYFNGDLTNITVIGAQISSTGNNAIDKYDFSNLNGLSVINTSITDPNGRGIFLTTFSDSSLKNILINNVNITGALYDGIYISMGNTNSGNVTITNTIINNNAGNGLSATTRGTVTINNNNFSNNGGGGIQLIGNNILSVTLNNNNISHNGNGLWLQGISGGNFQDNQLINNTGYDLYATGDTNNTFTRLTLGVAHPTTVTFDYIHGIIMNGVESPPADQSGLFNIGKYVDMQGLGSTNVNLKIHYNDSDVVGLNEASLKNFHFNTSWSGLPQPNGVNITERYVYADGISSFSIFAPLGEKPPAMLAVTDVSGLNGQTVNLEAALTSQGTPLAGKTIDFTVNGISIGSNVTDGTGIATFSYLITLTPGTYAINATFTGDGGYYATDATGTLNVHKNSTSTVLTDVTGVNGQNVNLQATLTNQDGTPLAGKIIDFTVNGTFVDSAVTDDNGIATLSYLITLTPDTYVINATFAGDSNYNNTYSTGIMTVYKNATILAVTDVTGVNGQNVQLKAILTNQDGTPLAGKTIQFTVNGADIGSATTGANGIATLAYTITQTLNTYVIGSIFTEDVNYNGTTGSGTLTVEAKPTAYATIKGGLYNANKNVSLKMNKINGTIYYTRNGSTPTTASTKYTGYLSISSTTTLKFIGVDSEGNVSPVYTEKYVIDKTAPKVTYTYPKNLSTGQSRTATLYLKFSENLKASTYWSKIYVKDLKTGKKVVITKYIKGNILYIKTNYKRASLRIYQVYVPYNAVKDFAGNNLVKTFAYKFKTRR